MKDYNETEGNAPVFEDYVDPNTPAGEIQGFANIAGAFNDKRDPTRRLYARIMVLLFIAPIVLGFIFAAIAAFI